MDTNFQCIPIWLTLHNVAGMDVHHTWKVTVDLHIIHSKDFEILSQLAIMPMFPYKNVVTQNNAVNVASIVCLPLL